MGGSAVLVTGGWPGDRHRGDRPGKAPGDPGEAMGSKGEGSVGDGEWEMPPNGFLSPL